MIEFDYDGHLLNTATADKVVDLCDYCKTDIHEGEQVYLCEDGTVLCDESCLMNYAMARLHVLTYVAKEEY